VPDQDGWLVELADQSRVVVDDLGQAETGELLGVLAELLDVAVLARPLGSGDREAALLEVGAFDDDPEIRPSVREFVAYAAPWEWIPDDGLPRYAASRN